ncbi:hypothetical protein QVD17_20953 [Tagetes erecta]|uniref:Nudix hydrolase domain-containing protein n=1 Tax=Tagetes erecta TaxID=13708 RepID=A0AAD8NYJ5_TARER|nr:hypothetical protein QVD17_20953 [Tagetes erecta]
MATVSLTTSGISPELRSDANTRLACITNIHGSLQSTCKFIKSPRQQQVQRSLFPLAVKSMKIIERSRKPGFLTNYSIFPTCNMSTSKLKVKIVRASYIDKGEISPAKEIGVLVFMLKDNKILVGRRRSLNVAGNIYLLPGGHLEPGESYEECAAREVKEETGLDIKNIELLTTVDHLYYGETHMNVTYLRAHVADPNQKPQNIEPDKCEGWEWYDLNNLPKPLFEPLRKMLQDGFNPFPITG